MTTSRTLGLALMDLLGTLRAERCPDCEQIHEGRGTVVCEDCGQWGAHACTYSLCPSCYDHDPRVQLARELGDLVDGLRFDLGIDRQFDLGPAEQLDPRVRERRAFRRDSVDLDEWLGDAF